MPKSRQKQKWHRWTDFVSWRLERSQEEKITSRNNTLFEVGEKVLVNSNKSLGNKLTPLCDVEADLGPTVFIKGSGQHKVAESSYNLKFFYYFHFFCHSANFSLILGKLDVYHMLSWFLLVVGYSFVNDMTAKKCNSTGVGLSYLFHCPWCQHTLLTISSPG